MTQGLEKDKAKALLQKYIDAIDGLKNSRGTPEFTKWKRGVEVAIENIFPKDSRHLKEFNGISFSPPAVPVVVYRDGTTSPVPKPQPYYELGLNKAKVILESMVDEIDTYWPDQPKPEESSGRKFTDRELMERCIELARNCTSEPGKISPKVAAIVARDGYILGEAYRGELKPGEHAEYTLLERKLGQANLVGATLFSTLEPCTSRNEPKVPCAQRVSDRKLAKVFIGTLDRNDDIRGRGEFHLMDSGIEIGRFDGDLMPILEDLNREFIRDIRNRTKAERQDPVSKDSVGPNGFKLGYNEDGDKVEWIEEDGELWPMILRRNDNHLVEEYSELQDRVWYVRKLIMFEKMESGEEERKPEHEPHIEKALQKMKEMEEKYGAENLVYDDIEWGIIQGKMAALAWVLGSDWDGAFDT